MRPGKELSCGSWLKAGKWPRAKFDLFSKDCGAMTIRRTLNQALNKPALNDAAKAFVTGAAPKLGETTNLSGESDTPFDSLLPRGTVDESVAMEKVREHRSAAEMDQQPPTGTVSMT